MLVFRQLFDPTSSTYTYLLQTITIVNSSATATITPSLVAFLSVSAF